MDSNEYKQQEAHLSQLASVGEVAAGIAHEVKNPLTAIKGFLHLLREKYEDNYIEIAHNEVDQALSTLESLLQISKPDMDSESFESINLAQELESTLHLFQDQMYDVDVHTDFQDEPTYIYGVKNQIKKALFNLIKNAFEAISGKGSIWIKHYTQDYHVKIEIQDSGVGIEKEKLSLLGTPFFTTKENGTGMGLTQVFSTIYQHKGRIEVESEMNEGTRFVISIPQESIKKRRGVIRMDLDYDSSMNLKNFVITNRTEFEKRLLDEAVNVRDKINDIQEIGKINLVDNAHKLVVYIIEEREREVTEFANQEGIVWAKHSLTLVFKLEWVQAIRRTLWDFIYNYGRLSEEEFDREDFFTIEKQMNDLMDQFLRSFFISYSHYKDDLIRSQRQIVVELSVPIIPVTSVTSVLPIIGEIDELRLETIEEKLMQEIGRTQIETLITDFSGMIQVEIPTLHRLFRTLEGVSMMGCKSVITGMRPDLVKQMIRENFSVGESITIKGTLQQALIDNLIIDHNEQRQGFTG